MAAVADPEEGVAADGTIRTGAHRDRVPAAFEPVLADAVEPLSLNGRGRAGCLTGLSDLTGRRSSGTSAISAEDPACPEDPVPPGLPDPPHKPLPPR